MPEGLDQEVPVSAAPESTESPATAEPSIEPAAPATPPSPEPSSPSPAPDDFPEFKLDLSSPSLATPEPTVSFSDEDIARYLAQKSHDDLKHIPAYNKTVQKAISKYRQDQEARAQENYQLAQWDQYFRSLPPQHLLAAREDPRTDAIYQKVREWRNMGSPVGGMTREKVAQDMVSGLHDYFSKDPRFSKVVESWDDYHEISDPGEFVQKVIEQGLKHREREIIKEAETKSKAYIKDVLAKRGIEMPVPVTQATSGSGAGGGLTYERYVNASPEEAMRFNPKEVDEVLARHRAAQRR